MSALTMDALTAAALRGVIQWEVIQELMRKSERHAGKIHRRLEADCFGHRILDERARQHFVINQKALCHRVRAPGRLETLK